MARKTYTCDLCGKQRNSLTAIGIDYNGDPDSPEVCFFCERELARDRVYDKNIKQYVYRSYYGEYQISLKD